MNDNVLIDGMILPRKLMIAEQGVDVLVFFPLAISQSSL